MTASSEQSDELNEPERSRAAKPQASEWGYGEGYFMGAGGFIAAAVLAWIASTRSSNSNEPSCRTLLMKNVGVPLTPLRTPLRKSCFTRGVNLG